MPLPTLTVHRCELVVQLSLSKIPYSEMGRWCSKHKCSYIKNQVCIYQKYIIFLNFCYINHYDNFHDTYCHISLIDDPMFWATLMTQQLQEAQREEAHQSKVLPSSPEFISKKGKGSAVDRSSTKEGKKPARPCDPLISIDCNSESEKFNISGGISASKGTKLPVRDETSTSKAGVNQKHSSLREKIECNEREETFVKPVLLNSEQVQRRVSTFASQKKRKVDISF